MVDPGHGLQDSANRGNNGYFEHIGMWKLAQYLKAALERCGAGVMLSRTEFETPTPEARGRSAKEFDCFISLHSNAFDGSVRGTEVWYSVLRDDVQFARRMSAAVSTVMGNPDRGAKTRTTESGMLDYYAQIREAAWVMVPHILLVEHGFHDNDIDEAFLLQDSNLEKIAEAEAQVICTEFDIDYKPLVSEYQFPTSAAWVKEQGISDGQRPKIPVTREELWEMLYRQEQKR